MRALTTVLFLLFSGYINSQTARIYPCRTACDIGVQIGNYTSGDSISASGLLKAVGLKCEAGEFTILSYRITIDGPGICELYEITNSGNKFTDYTRSVFRKLLRPGVFIGIDCITAKDAIGYITGLKPAIYIIR